MEKATGKGSVVVAMGSDILNDSEFAVLRHRTNVNLKDKWRNIQKDWWI